MFFSETVHAVDLLLAFTIQTSHPSEKICWFHWFALYIFSGKCRTCSLKSNKSSLHGYVCHIIVCVSIYASSSMFWGSFMWWLVAKLNEQASSTGHPLQTRGTFFLQRMFWHCTINSRSFNLKSYNKKSSVTYCFNILKKWSESCQNVLILQILQCRRCQLQYIFKRLQANLNEVWWIIMVPFLIPSLVNLHFGKAHLASWTNQLMVLQVDQINSFCWPNNWSSFL